ncbi:tyrosine-type recombinase/integrase [Natronolimnohabitans innermongolicus]|uniref:Site-specific recombinase XerD-like protein n=1 Tax=Natronolimnohabitans innermongolicus JCM 12255 TaxID=1227499 RepID=L9WHI6_9EURY|nr:site-specific integrase [Natronolimnohabitans innermongolicus]ELY48817.1 Site-specific recombinase XerD-like protein [Natronolimnohabitans innermongolicus JCM 12255]
MSDAETGTESNAEVAVVDAVDAYLQRKAVGDPDGSGAGTYASNAESILRRWADWLDDVHDVTSLFALERSHMRAYADELRGRADRGEYTPSTARTYYAVVRAFLSWCVRGAILESNPAATDVAEAALPTPEDRSTVGDDAWTNDQRRRLEGYVRERALAAASDDREPDHAERVTRLREYAMVALLAHSGVRGSELFRVPDDDRRTGATWDDVDFYTGTIRVLGKSQRLEEVTMFAPARTALRRYRVVLDPPSNDWPLFPTRHAPSIAGRVREALRERGHDDPTIEALLEDRTATELARDRAIAPPTITTEGARSVLKRLCGDAGVDVDGDYLTPRGVRSDRPDDGTRREARPSKPQLRAPSFERTLAVPREPPRIEFVDSWTDLETERESETGTGPASTDSN